jgi:phage shock protein E
MWQAKYKSIYFRVTAIFIGAIAGYAYYHYIGCASGTCPITGNPWLSTTYGAIVGGLAAPWKKKTIKSTTESENQK